MINDQATVGLSYCNKTEFLHEHATALEAIEEYAKLLGEMVEPNGENSDKVHLRVLTLTCFDGHSKVHSISSGIFDCDHVA